MNGYENNKMYFNGEIVSEPTLTHTVYDEGFYEFDVRIPRLSGAEDILPVTISERLFCGQEIGKGTKINAVGQFRSYNKIEDERSRLVLTVFVQELLTGETEENPNSIMLNGYVCKPPIYRTTPFNREIAELLIAVNRAYNKSDYIPCVAWGQKCAICEYAFGRGSNRRIWASAEPTVREEILRDGYSQEDRLRGIDQ